MEEHEKEEMDALCPECGHAFKAFVDRLVGGAAEKPQKEPVDCPVCGCHECKLNG